VDPLGVDIKLLLSTLESEVRLLPGRVLAARVVENANPARGTLSLAGRLLEAQLPAHLQAGDQVRLTVREIGADRVVLSLAGPPIPPASLDAPRQLRDQGDQDGSEQPTRRGGSGASGHAVALRYNTSNIGAMDLRLQLGDGKLHVLLALAPGEPLALARGDAGELRERLASATGMQVEVVVQARKDPLEVYA
jgi:hypothetical protein